MIDIVRSFRQAAESRGMMPPGGGMSLSDFDGVLDMLVGGGQPSYTGKLVSPRNAVGVAAVWACLNVLSDDFATLPMPAYRWIQPGISREEARDHYLWHLFNDEANPRMSSFDFKKIMETWRNLWGNAYAEIETNGRGQVVALWPWRPDRVKVWQRDRNDPKSEIYYTYLPIDHQAPAITRSQDQMLHVKGITIDGIVGISPIEAHRQGIGLAMAMTEHSARFYGRGSVLKGVFTHPGKLGTKGEENIQEKLRQYQGVANSFKTMILEEGMTYKDVGIPQADAQYIESLNFSGEDICRIYKVPQHRAGYLARATFCLPGETKIFTESGPVRIDEVKVGDMVWSRSEDRFVLRKIEKCGQTGEDKILTIRTRNRTLRCNAQHRVATWRKTLEPFTEGKGKCTVIDGKPFRAAWSVAWVPAGDLLPGDVILAATDVPTFTGIRSCPTRENVSVEFMELIGMLVGDGFFFRGVSGAGSGFGISHPEKSDYAAHYVGCAEREFLAFDGPYGRRNGGDQAIKSKLRDKNTTIFYSGKAYDELDVLGIVGTAHFKRIPHWIFKLDRELKLAFLRGYLDADGTVNAKGAVRFVSVSKDLIDDTRHLCASVGITVGNVFSTEILSDFGTGKTYHHTLWAAICSRASETNEIGSHTAMYRDRLAARMESIKTRRVRLFPCEEKSRYCGPGLAPSGIDEIEISEDVEPVYDLCVEKDHNFIADLTLVHNSNIEHAGIEYVQYTLGPNARNWTSQAHCWLLSSRERDSVFLEPDYSYILAADHAARAQYITARASTASISPDEIRHMEGQNPLPNGLGKLPRAMVNTAPLDSEIASGNPAPDPAAGKTSKIPPPEPKPKANGMLTQ